MMYKIPILGSGVGGKLANDQSGGISTTPPFIEKNEYGMGVVLRNATTQTGTVLNEPV